ncbi:MAG: FkbM family methyltransferase [Burkholderiales bacterium]|nr:FkbM family methyltransferase [Opitutaceae bacterium]
MRAAAVTLEDYSRSSWRRGIDLYLAHPFVHAGRWFRYMSRRVWPGRALRFTDGHGNRYVSMKNNFTSFAVAVLGERDPDVMRFLRSWIRPGFVACDIGANIGTYTLPLSRLVGPTGRVISFEPNRPTYACLRHNVRQNRLANVVVLRAAAGPHPGHAGLVVTDENFGEVHLDPAGGPGHDRVAVTTVDAEVARLGLSRVDYIKIDVEGFELAALRGAERTLATNANLVVQTEIVAAHAARYGFGVAELAEFFASLGYRPFVCDAQGRMHAVAAAAEPIEADWFWARSEAVFAS